MNTISELIQAIRRRGGKVTPQRLAVYQELERDRSHPSADAIFGRVRQTLPTISPATVYKTLNELVAIGEVRRFDVHGVSHFDARTDDHAEVVCLGCDSIVDVPAAVPARRAPAVPGFEIVGQTQTFYGYCEGCRAAGKAVTAAGLGRKSNGNIGG